MTCMEQLASFHNQILNSSLSQQRVLSLSGSSSLLHPLPGTTIQKHFGPVALTAVIMKPFEELIQAERVVKAERVGPSPVRMQVWEKRL